MLGYLPRQHLLYAPRRSALVHHCDADVDAVAGDDADADLVHVAAAAAFVVAWRPFVVAE